MYNFIYIYSIVKIKILDLDKNNNKELLDQDNMYLKKIRKMILVVLLNNQNFLTINF